MNTFARTFRLLPILLITTPAFAQDVDEVVETGCTTCHGDADLWEGETAHLLVKAEDLAADVHWQKGIRCHDCHGGNAETINLRQAHAEEDGFRRIDSPTDVATFCGHCHSDLEYMRRYQPTIDSDPVAVFLKGIHGQHLQQAGPTDAASCLACHAKHAIGSTQDPASAIHPSQLSALCGHCHQEQRNALREDVHGRPPTAGQDAALPLDCGTCHGSDLHAMVSVKDPQSPVFVKQQVQTCGHCHAQGLESYTRSVHGHGLEVSGLLVTAVCSSCHRAHGVFPANDTRSALHVTNAADTCSTCHRFIHERLQQSVHGRTNGPGRETNEAAPGGDIQRAPSCTDCHQGHDQPHPETLRFRQESSSRCGDCHGELQQGYELSLHGELTDLGYGPAAKCSDCHGGHDVLPASNPASPISAARRLETCQKCHLDASANFADFDPHADHRNPQRDPVIYWVYMTLMTLLLTTIGLFGLHSVLWFVRSLIDVARHSRPHSLVPGNTAYVRFSKFHRWAHVILLVAFLGLTLTGLPLKYSHTAWARALAETLGGFSSMGLWHRIFGLVSFSYLVIYVIWAAVRIMTKPRRVGSLTAVVFGGDSPIPNRRDLGDFIKMMRWFFGLGSKPSFERWGYWEKVDIWGALADIVIIGLTGLILWFPELVTQYLPGRTLNIAKVIHSTQALLATGFVFAIHFFNTHVRPEKFPMDLSMFVGLVSEEELKEERPDYYERLRREGRLEEFQATVPSRRVLRLVTFGGSIAIAVGAALLVGIVVAIVRG